MKSTPPRRLYERSCTAERLEASHCTLAAVDWAIAGAMVLLIALDGSGGLRPRCSASASRVGYRDYVKMQTRS